MLYDIMLYYIIAVSQNRDALGINSSLLDASQLAGHDASLPQSYRRRKGFCIESVLHPPCIPVSLWGYKEALDNLCRMLSAYRI